MTDNYQCIHEHPCRLWTVKKKRMKPSQKKQLNREHPEILQKRTD